MKVSNNWKIGDKAKLKNKNEELTIIAKETYGNKKVLHVLSKITGEITEYKDDRHLTKVKEKGTQLRLK